ncbi:MFS transporter [Kitasatospora sp. NPDC096147]|uniref:MFS transporter n=1 Tax=Kitasatospora sp. NPDC096147 TaxID=3364093 RepID=UPI003817703C
MTTHPLDARTALRRYATVSALLWFPIGLTIAPLILLLTARGLTLPTITLLMAVYSLTTAVLELPTGGLSDVLGRRVVLAAAGVLSIGALVLQALSTAVWLLVVAMVLTGTVRALFSGSVEAWYVDTVQAAEGPDADLRAGFARAGTVTSVALAAGTLLGGAVPWALGLGSDPGAALTRATDGLVLPLSVPMLAAAGVAVFAVLYVLTSLPEPTTDTGTGTGTGTLRAALGSIPATIRDGLRLGGGDRLVRRILLSTAAAGGGIATVELLTPGRAAALTGGSASGAVLYAALACTGFLCSGLGSQLGPFTARLAGSGERAVLLGLTVSAGGLALLGATTALAGPVALALGATGYGLIYLGLGAAGPSESELLHHRIPGESRATVLSAQSLSLQLAGAVTGLTVGRLPAGPLPWLTAAAVVLAGALLWARRHTPALTDAHPAKESQPA